MTIGQLIKRLQRFNPDIPVVLRNKGNPPDDFVELRVSDIVELKTKEVFKNPFWGTQLYDASEGARERSTKVLSLSGGTNFQRGSDEPQD
jgi:hypothetical protein